MLTALSFGLISGFSLFLGAWVGTIFKFNQKTIAAFIAFGSGVLICALTFGLMEEAFSFGGFDAVIIGFLLGGLVFIIGDYLLHVFGGRKHRRLQMVKTKKEPNGLLITFGAVLDGIPESIALGVTLFSGGGKGILMLAAIFLSNFPESIASLNGLRQQKFSKTKIYGIWIIVGAVSAAFVVFSYLFLKDIDPDIIGALEAFAAGAILAMLADSMVPEAFEEGGFLIGALTVLGFLTAFVISKV